MANPTTDRKSNQKYPEDTGMDENGIGSVIKDGEDEAAHDPRQA